MREIRSYGSAGVSAGNRRHYPAETKHLTWVSASPLQRFVQDRMV